MKLSLGITGHLTFHFKSDFETLMKYRPNAFLDSYDILFKDGAYYCYCAYVLRISRYSSFLSVMITNTRMFLRGLKLSEKLDKSK